MLLRDLDGILGTHKSAICQDSRVFDGACPGAWAQEVPRRSADSWQSATCQDSRVFDGACSPLLPRPIRTGSGSASNIPGAWAQEVLRRSGLLIPDEMRAPSHASSRPWQQLYLEPLGAKNVIHVARPGDIHGSILRANSSAGVVKHRHSSILLGHRPSAEAVADPSSSRPVAVVVLDELVDDGFKVTSAYDEPAIDALPANGAH